MLEGAHSWAVSSCQRNLSNSVLFAARFSAHELDVIQAPHEILRTSREILPRVFQTYGTFAVDFPSASWFEVRRASFPFMRPPFPLCRESF